MIIRARSVPAAVTAVYFLCLHFPYIQKVWIPAGQPPKHIANQIVEERVLLQELSNTLEVELQQIWKPGLWALELGAPGMGAAALAQGQSSQEPL